MRSLPRGRHGLSREFVAQNQLQRLLASTAETLHELGYDKATVSLITTRARVSKSDFYRHFASKDACFLAAYDDATARLRKEVRAACGDGGDWPSRVIAALDAVLAFLAREPAVADLLLVEGLRAGPQVYRRFQNATRSYVALLGEVARSPSDDRDGLHEAVVGGIVSLLSHWVLTGDADELERFLPEVAQFALVPYLGAAEARRIVSRR